MPPKKCASCTKTVFPVEELKCLDKIWHKFCFKCQVCNMTLNMKNYKGYDKLPYCNAHYPETKFTSVAETPESKRLAQNSKIQSNVKYHEEYEKERGQYTSVADDPETLRVKKNMETISNASYHGDLARRQEMESTRPNEYETAEAPPRSYQPPPTSYQAPPTSYTAPPKQQQQKLPQAPQSYQPQQPMAPPAQQGYGRRPGNINDYDPKAGITNSPYSSKTQSTTVYNSQGSSQGGRYSSSSDYDQRGSQYNQRSSQLSNQSYNSGGGTGGVGVGGGGGAPYQQQQSSHTQPPQQSYTGQSQVPINHPQQQAYRPAYNPAMQPPQQQPMRQQPQQQPQQQQRGQPAPQRVSQPPPVSRDPYYGKGKVSRSMYDYAAADEDEIGFREGDLIINCEPIDEGWMMGTVERTGQSGMLPSNYVEQVNW